MDKKIEKIKNFRIYLLNQLDDLSTEQWNRIPTGYNNNIIWNVAHLICAQQNMCYARSGLSVIVEDRYFSPYMPGTKPQGFIDQSEIDIIKNLFVDSIDKLHLDFEKGMFENYSPSVMIPKVYGFEVININEAIEYLLYHEGFHSGYILSLKHVL